MAHLPDVSQPPPPLPERQYVNNILAEGSQLFTRSALLAMPTPAQLTPHFPTSFPSIPYSQHCSGNPNCNVHARWGHAPNGIDGMQVNELMNWSMQSESRTELRTGRPEAQQPPTPTDLLEATAKGMQTATHGHPGIRIRTIPTQAVLCIRQQYVKMGP